MNGERDSRVEDLVPDEPSTVDEHEERLGDDVEDLGDGDGGGVPVLVVPTPPVTGDEAVDEAMMRLAESQAGSFAERIEAGEHAHRSLQSRLGGLGGA